MICAHFCRDVGTERVTKEESVSNEDAQNAVVYKVVETFSSRDKKHNALLLKMSGGPFKSLAQFPRISEKPRCRSQQSILQTPSR